MLNKGTFSQNRPNHEFLQDEGGLEIKSKGIEDRSNRKKVAAIVGVNVGLL
jgi:hypothetical protein